MTDSTSHSMYHSADPSKPDPNFVKWLNENCVPITGAVFCAFVLCLIAHYGSAKIDWTRTKEFTEALANVTQSVALIGGGVWAYFKFAKGRTFRERLIPKVTGKFVSLDGAGFLVVTIHLNNVGLSRIAFDHASQLSVLEYVPALVNEIVSVRNQRLATYEVFGDKDGFIESNEVIERQSLIALPRVSNIAYKLELKVLTKSGYAWRVTTIVYDSGFGR